MTSRRFPAPCGLGFSAEMRLLLHRQLLELLLAFVLGLGVGLLYELLRPLRCRGGALAAALLDLLFCLLSGLGAFCYAMSAGSGRLGLWELSAMLLGFLLHLHWLSPPLRRVLAAGERLWLRLTGPLKKVLAAWVDSAKKRYQKVRK